MCTGLEIAALVTAVGGTAAGAAGQSAAKKTNARLQGQQTELSRDEFNKRNTLANEIFAENTGVSRQVYDELNSLDDQSFAARTGLSKQAFNQLDQIEREQIIRDAAASSANTGATRDARIARDATRDDAASRYTSTLDAANARQEGFRSQADAIAAELLAAFAPEAMAANRAGAATSRDALVGQAMTPASGPAVAGNVDPQIAAAFARYSDAARTGAATRAAAASKVGSYGDAIAVGDRAINRGNEGVTFIRDASERAMAPVGAQLGAQALRYSNAADAYKGRTGAADADLEAALGLSKTQATGATRGVTSYTGAMDEALINAFGGKAASATGRGNTLVGANEARLAGTNAVSQNLESGMSNINQFRAANASSPWTTLSQFAGAVTPTLFNQASQNGTGFGFRKPTPTPAPAIS